MRLLIVCMRQHYTVPFVLDVYFVCHADCRRSKGDVVFVVDINPIEHMPQSDVSNQFRLKMKFIADIVNSVQYGGDSVRVGLTFLSYTRVSFTLFLHRY